MQKLKSMPTCSQPEITLEVFQRAMAMLYTDAALRNGFMRNPALIAGQLRLSQAQAESLRDAIGEDLNIFGRSLLNKRLNEAAQYLPGLLGVLGEAQFRKLFLQYAAQEAVSQAGNKPLMDALRFTEYLATLISKENEIPPWMVELGRYEACWLLMRHTTRRFLAKQFTSQIDQMKPGDFSGPKQGRFLGVWFRVGSSLRSFRVRIS